MATKTTITLCLLGLLTCQLASSTSIDDDFSFEEYSSNDVLLPRNIRSVISLTKNELKAPEKKPFDSFIDFLVPKLLNTTLGKLIVEAVQDTPKFVSKVNTLVSREVLILKGNSLRISYSNLLAAIKDLATNFLEKNLKLHGFILNLAEGFLNNILDKIGRIIKPVIDETNFSVSTKPTSLQAADNTTGKNVIRKLLVDVVIILVKPFQSRINQTLVNVTEELLLLYKPVLPNNYFESIVTCGINQSILKVIEVIDSTRETLNRLLSTSSVKKRSLDITEDTNEKKTRSLLGLILAPIRFLLSLILKPIHNLLWNIMNYVFVTLRPVVGKIILSPIEAIVMAIINIIPH